MKIRGLIFSTTLSRCDLFQLVKFWGFLCHCSEVYGVIDLIDPNDLCSFEEERNAGA